VNLRPLNGNGRVYTAEERVLFTVDEEVLQCVENVFPRGQVERAENEPGFLGWVCCRQRPLALTKDSIVLYGFTGSVFPHYQDALDAAVRTLRWAGEHAMPWFHDGKIRIFNLSKTEAAE
jgi:hypothetical protein